MYNPDCQIDEIVIVAPGPSLTQEQCDIVSSKGKFIIVIGNAWRMVRYADILYHCDAKWWRYHKGCPDFRGDKRISLEPTEYTDHVLETIQTEGFAEYPAVVTGGNSGYQALNIALHFKPNKIILIGFDMKDSADGRHNIDGDHPPSLKRGFNSERNINSFRSVAELLETMGVKVYNCTLDSALDCFEKRELIDVI